MNVSVAEGESAPTGHAGVACSTSSVTADPLDTRRDANVDRRVMRAYDTRESQNTDHMLVLDERCSGGRCLSADCRCLRQSSALTGESDQDKQEW